MPKKPSLILFFAFLERYSAFFFTAFLFPYQNTLDDGNDSIHVRSGAESTPYAIPYWKDLLAP